MIIRRLWQNAKLCTPLNLIDVIHQSLKTFFTIKRFRPDCAKVSNDERLITHDELIAPEPLDQGRLKENLALLDVVLFENFGEGHADLLEVDLTLFLENLCLLREKQDHHCVDMFLGHELLRNAKAGK